nr:nudix hydrolase 2-like [Ipomoea batatas]GMD32028.1 nudix hydrolase 2-like [Ipomoea batatas]
MAGKQQEGGIAPLVFEAAEDAYGGVTVELSEWSMDSGDFVTVLRASLSQWRHQGKKGVWMKLSIQLACFVDAAVKVRRVLVPPCRGNVPYAGLLDSKTLPTLFLPMLLIESELELSSSSKLAKYITNYIHI